MSKHMQIVVDDAEIDTMSIGEKQRKEEMELRL